jgi:hypothetical protein
MDERALFGDALTSSVSRNPLLLSTRTSRILDSISRQITNFSSFPFSSHQRAAIASARAAQRSVRRGRNSAIRAKNQLQADFPRHHRRKTVPVLSKITSAREERFQTSIVEPVPSIPSRFVFRIAIFHAHESAPPRIRGSRPTRSLRNPLSMPDRTFPSDFRSSITSAPPHRESRAKTRRSIS